MNETINNIILHLDNYLCRIVSTILNLFHFKAQIFFDEMPYGRYLKRKYGYISIPIEEKKLEQGDTIWTFWAQGLDNMPPKIRCCYDSLIRNKGQYKVILIDGNNVSDYLVIPERIKELRKSGKMSWTHFSDYLRVSLLAKYGGWYIDSTVYVTRTVPTMNKLFTIRLKERDYSAANGNWCGFLWYMPKGHPVSLYTLKFLDEYWRTNDKIIVYLLIDHIINIFFSKSSKYRSELKSIPYSCPELLFFQSSLSEEKYEEAKWEELVKRNLFFKNNWRTKLTMSLPDGSKTYYEHIFGNYQN